MENDERLVLNRALYRRCKATFKHVLIRNPSEKQTRKLSRDLLTGKRRPVISHPGEYYSVCCPFCNDTRYRCYINHRYGTDDEFGRPQTHLATCFNAGCPLAGRSSEMYQQLAEMLCGHHLIELRKAPIAEGREVDVDQIRMNWPGTVTRVDRLPSDHEARIYLAGRGFDPDVIGSFWNVHWCSESPRYICQERLIIPIYHRKRMVGWQARAAYDMDWKNTHLPKYYTAPGTPRRQILYNFGNAVNYRTGVIVEGVTDVWKVGPMAVCTLGATMTSLQRTLFKGGFKAHSGVLLYDPDVKATVGERAAAWVAELADSLNSGFCTVQLPDGTDPGSLSRSFLRPYIAQQAAEQGVTVSWKRR
jgi:hypothetical protein